MFKAGLGSVIVLKLFSGKLSKLIRFNDLKTKVYCEKCSKLNSTKEFCIELC